MMAGIRFLSAGGLLLAYLLATGHSLPPLRPLLNAALIGILLLAVGNGFVTGRAPACAFWHCSGHGGDSAALHALL